MTILSSFFIVGCSGLKQTMGLEKAAPQELSVHPYEKALEIPPCIKEMPKEQDQTLENKVSSQGSASPSAQQKSQPKGGTVS